MPATTASATALIALDWGSSNLRARRLGPDGQVLEERAAALGVLQVPPGGFEHALDQVVGDWLVQHPGAALLASGMVGSRQGWVEAPYLPCPATLAQAAQRLTAVPLQQATHAGRVLHIVPGLQNEAQGRLDVMRGEETQLWGAGLPAGGVCVLPGTHSKWVWMGEAGQVQAFQTHMTGELYALLRQHSLLGRLMADAPADAAADAGHQSTAQAAFQAGVQQGLAQGAALLHLLFSVRTAGLFHQWPATALADLLSGLLIGAELQAALATRRPAQVHLLGEDSLCTRYAQALALAGVDNQAAPAQATVAGQWALAQAAGLVA
jgi:2-dehydro-3-deoxygalactonokinase